MIEYSIETFAELKAYIEQSLGEEWSVEILIDRWDMKFTARRDDFRRDSQSLDLFEHHFSIKEQIDNNVNLIRAAYQRSLWQEP